MSREPKHLESIPARWLSATCVLGAFGMVAGAVAQALIGPVGAGTALSGLLVLLAMFFVWLAWALRRLVLQLDRHGVRVRFGPFGRFIRWRDVTTIELTSRRRSEAGIHLGRYDGRAAWYYTLIGGQRLAVVTRKNGPAPLIVTTRQPEDALAVGRSHIPRRNRDAA